jgi:predicted amidohydrolase
MPVGRDVRENLVAIGQALEFAAGEGADILLTPEGSLSGYSHEFDQQAVGRALSEVVARAAGLKVGLALGTCFREEPDGRCYNQVRFYDREGAYLGFHGKIVRCGTLEERPRGEIEHFAARPLRTFSLHGLTVGGLICNDLWANPGCTPITDPHLTQTLARMGAQVIFHAVNGDRDGSQTARVCWQYHESNLRLRAAAGKVWIVTADNCAPEHVPCSSPSGVVRPDGTWAVRAAPSGQRHFAFTIE